MNTKANLIAVTKTPVKSKHKTHEETYEYEVNGQFVKFHAHPTRAWNWVILAGDPKLTSKVISAACKAGFELDEMKVLDI